MNFVFTAHAQLFQRTLQVRPTPNMSFAFKIALDEGAAALLKEFLVKSMRRNSQIVREGPDNSVIVDSAEKYLTNSFRAATYLYFGTPSNDFAKLHRGSVLEHDGLCLSFDEPLDCEQRVFEVTRAGNDVSIRLAPDAR